MALFDKFITKRVDKLVEEKLNSAQPFIGGQTEPSKEYTNNYTYYYENLEIVNRGINMIVDDCSIIPSWVSDQTRGLAVVKGLKKVKVSTLLNEEPNLFQDVSTFRRNLYLDYLLDGNIFIYFDGAHLYHIPASRMTIKTSSSSYIDSYEFDGGKVVYSPNEIIHIKENSFESIYRGTSRLKPALRTMQLLQSMRKFQDNFFKNGAVAGLVIKSPNTLSEKIKARMLQAWTSRYNPEAGGRRPLILDGGLDVDTISDVTFKDLDFQLGIESNEKILLKALGVPPILLDSGNNANLRPNMRMYYLETVIPIVKKLNFAYQRFFGFRIEEDVTNIPAMQPELTEQSQYFTTLVNGGVIYVNEAREALGFEKDSDPESDELRIPANIAGSAVDPSEGGRPEEGEDNNG